MVEKFFSETLVTLEDSDKHTIFANVKYNRMYKKDFRVTCAFVEINGQHIPITNLEMVVAQYGEDIQAGINSWERVLTGGDD